MYRYVIFYGLLFLIYACSESRVSHDQLSVTTAAENRDLNENTNLSQPGDPNSIFDLNVFERIGSEDPAAAIKTDLLRGGLLYDTWWVFNNGSIGAVPPITSNAHPAWPTPNNLNTDVTTTWRCVSCHGWDYIGVEGVFGDPIHPNFTGIGGIIQPSASSPTKLSDPALIFDFIHSGQTTAGALHDFGVSISDDDIYALTRFIVTQQNLAIDPSINAIPSSIIDVVSKKALADQAKGFVKYHDVITDSGCAQECHGIDGKLLILTSTEGVDLTEMANNDPWQVLHKIRFGQPGSVPFMVGASPSTDELVNFSNAASVLSYVQVGLLRDFVRGGRLYENFFAENNQTIPVDYNILWDQRDFSFDAPVAIEDSWTCSACHGFDYFGQMGFDNSLLYLRERPWTEDYVFNKLGEGFTVRLWPAPSILTTHNYQTMLTDDDLWDLVAFLMTGITDTYRYIYTTWSSNGDFETGRQLFQTPYTVQGACVTCHGLDGIGGGIADNPSVDIFTFAWDAPWEYMHKIRFGIAGKNMPAIENSLFIGTDRLAIEFAADIHQYTQQRIDQTVIP